jgi:hypothetical protein
MENGCRDRGRERLADWACAAERLWAGPCVSPREAPLEGWARFGSGKPQADRA